MALYSSDRKHNLTYQEIVNEFATACNLHLAINSFDTGTLDFLDANAVNKLYPYVYLRPIVSTGVVDKERSLTFELYSMDVPKLSNESPVEVLSKTEMYIYDLIAYFVEGDNSRQQIYGIDMTSITPVNEAFQDRVYGWVAEIDILTPWKWDYCDFPKN